jgi:hypothetical protein
MLLVLLLRVLHTRKLWLGTILWSPSNRSNFRSFFLHHRSRALTGPTPTPAPSGQNSAYNGGLMDGFGGGGSVASGYGAPAPDPFAPPDNAFAQPAFAQPAAAQPNPNAGYGVPPQQSYPPQQQGYGQPQASAPIPQYTQQPDFGSPPPHPTSVPRSDQDFTPTSSLGFASPNEYARNMHQAYGGPNGAFNEPGHEPEEPPPESLATPSDPALFSMNVLSGHATNPDPVSSNGTSNGGGSLADQAYAKLVNLDAFDLVKGTAQERHNPFEASSAMSQVSLSDMKSKSSNVVGENARGDPTLCSWFISFFVFSLMPHSLVRRSLS